MRKLTTRVLIGLGGTTLALLACAEPAHAATPSGPTFVSPASGPITPAVDKSGNPTPTDVTVDGYGQGTAVFIEVCDGKNPAAPGWSPGNDCDNETSPTQIVSTGPNDQLAFTNASGEAAVLFRGNSPSGGFNCLAPEDTTSGKDPSGGNVKPIGSTTANGDQIDPSVPSWNDCQIRVSSNTAGATSDQIFLTLSLPNTVNAGPSNALPEVPLAIILPLSAAGLFAGGIAINRRRRRHPSAA